MEACDWRHHWEKLCFLEDTTKEQSFLIADDRSPSFAPNPRYGSDRTDSSSLLESRVASQYLDELNEPMSRDSPEVFSFRTSPLGEALSPQESQTNGAGMTMLANRGAPRSSRGVTTPDVINKRKRKEQEKNRRDKLCAKVDQISKLLPAMDCTSKKPTKVEILRTAASQLRLHYHFPSKENLPLGTVNGQIRPAQRWRPDFMDDSVVTDIFDAAGGFLLVTDMAGLILFATHNIENFLGYQNTDVMGNHLFDYIHEKDCAKFGETFEGVLKRLGRTSIPQGGDLISAPCTILCKFLEKPAARSDILSYKVMLCTAILRGPMQDQGINRSLLKLTLYAQVVDFNPMRKFGVMDMIQNEYITRHTTEGTIVFADHRISSLTGYFPDEVLRESAHKFMVEEDIPVAMFALNRMLAKNHGTVVYRLQTASGKPIYLRSFGVVTYNSKMEPEMFVCYNTLLDEKSGEAQRQKFVQRYTTHIQDQQNKSKAIAAPGTVARISHMTEAVDEEDHVCGVKSQNCLAIENLIEEDLKVSGNSMIKIKPKGYDTDECPYGSDAYEEQNFAAGSCMQNENEIKSVATVTHNTCLSDRESNSPEFRGAPTPGQSASPPLNCDMGSPRLLPVNQHPSNQGYGGTVYDSNNHWLHPTTEAYSHPNRVTPSPTYPMGSFAMTPNSLSPDPRDVHDRIHRHDYST